MRPSRSGGSVGPDRTSPSPTPVLTYLGGGAFSWTWGKADPDLWGIFSTSLLVPAGALDYVTGENRSESGSIDANDTYCIRGTNESQDEFTTPTSNFVIVSDL